jgi:AcrR family transcriptional regulator
MPTKRKILETALELFNTGNTQAATTNHIAAAAGMSPGNLHYHFKNREAIIRRLYEQMRDEFTLLPDAYPTTAAEMITIHEQVFEIQWKYRFFYRELLFLLSRDPELERQYRKDAQAQKGRIIVILNQLSEKGVFTVLSEKDADYLSDMILLIEQFWSSYMQLCDAEGSTIDIAKGIRRIEQTLWPYLSKVAREQMSSG